MKVSISVNNVEWHFLPELPDRDCKVWYVKEWTSFPVELSTVDYTTAAGWNTHRASSGELYSKSAFDLAPTAWTYDDPYTVEVIRDETV